MPARKHSSELHQWLDQMISRRGGPEQLVSKTAIDFADRRVREFTENETDKNRAFLSVSNKMAEMMYMLKVKSVAMSLHIVVNLLRSQNFPEESSDTPTVALKISGSS